jgi:hypothetical protein
VAMWQNAKPIIVRCVNYSALNLIRGCTFHLLLHIMNYIKTISLLQWRQWDLNPYRLIPANGQKQLTCSRAQKYPYKLHLTCSLVRKICDVHTRHQSDAIVPRRVCDIDVAFKRVSGLDVTIPTQIFMFGNKSGNSILRAFFWQWNRYQDKIFISKGMVEIYENSNA